MSLFEFELLPVDQIEPWRDGQILSLSWFALTFGSFRVNLGGDALFEYSDAIRAHRISKRYVDYQVAAIARDILSCTAAALAPVPELFKAIVSNCDVLDELRKRDSNVALDDEVAYAAWRWLGERSPTMSYFVAFPTFEFVRLDGVVLIHWDNRDRLIDGMPVWTASHGRYLIPADEFMFECRTFAKQLLDAMASRIGGIESGLRRPLIPLNVASLREQHETWRIEFESYFGEYRPDVPWAEAEAALRSLALSKGIKL